MLAKVFLNASSPTNTMDTFYKIITITLTDRSAIPCSLRVRTHNKTLISKLRRWLSN